MKEKKFLRFIAHFYVTIKAVPNKVEEKIKLTIYYGIFLFLFYDDQMVSLLRLIVIPFFMGDSITLMQ